MKRVVLLVLLASSCLDFERRVADCFDGGVCVTAVDGGRDGGTVLPPAFDAGFFCTDQWCWESPFPHGVTLNTVFAEGDDLVVAGEFGMLAERTGGQWRSLQAAHSRTFEWTSLWGRSMNDLWLAGDERAWHRTVAGWGPVGARFMVANSRAVAGTSTETFVSAGPQVFKLAGDEWDGLTSVGAGEDVTSLSVAFGALYAAVRTNLGSGRVANLDGGDWAFDGGAMFSLFTTSNGLYATGERTVRLDEALQPSPLADVLRAGVEAEQQVFAATAEGVGRLRDGGFRLEQRSPPVNAMTAGRSVVAVGDRGLMLERRDGGWVDPTPTSTRSDLVALFERQSGLFALTAECELLERAANTWSRRKLALERCTDAVSGGTSLVVLTESGNVVTFDAELAEVERDALSAGLVTRKLWRAENGALVVTTATETFVKQPGRLFEPVRPLGGTGSWGVSGRGSVARICGLDQDKVFDLDVSRAPALATEVTGLLAHDCRAVLPLRNGLWALGSRGGGDFPRLRFVEADGSTTDVRLDAPATFIEALAETPSGIAVASDRYTFVPFATRVPTPPPGFSGISEVAVFGGRVFVGGAGGSILQAPAP